MYHFILIYLFTEKLESYFKYPKDNMIIKKIKRYHECTGFVFWYVFLVYLYLLFSSNLAYEFENTDKLERNIIYVSETFYNILDLFLS